MPGGGANRLACGVAAVGEIVPTHYESVAALATRMASNQAESDKVMAAFDGATPEMCCLPLHGIRLEGPSASLALC